MAFQTLNSTPTLCDMCQPCHLLYYLIIQVILVLRRFVGQFHARGMCSLVFNLPSRTMKRNGINEFGGGELGDQGN